MHFIVIARDGTDDLAPSRRAAVRGQHLSEIAPLVASGTVQLGGAILDEAGEMIGSVMLIQAISPDAVRSLLERDVYSTAGVWQRLEILPFRIATHAKDTANHA